MKNIIAGKLIWVLQKLLVTILVMIVIVFILWVMDIFFANMGGGTVINWRDPIHSIGVFGWTILTIISFMVFLIGHYISES